MQRFDRYQRTFQTWNKVASLYQDKFMDLDLYHDTYDKFCGLLDKPDPAILEVGCGPGNITRYLLRIRPDFRIEGIDVASNMIELAKVNNPGVHFQVMDARDIGSLPSKYDAVIAGFCMPYLSKDDSAKFIHDCAGLLVKGGIFYLSIIKGDYANSGLVAASTGDQTYVYYYSEDDLRQELGKNNFEVLAVINRQFPRADGSFSDDMIFLAKKK